MPIQTTDERQVQKEYIAYHPSWMEKVAAILVVALLVINSIWLFVGSFPARNAESDVQDIKNLICESGIILSGIDKEVVVKVCD